MVSTYIFFPLQKYKAYAWLNDLLKCFKICHILVNFEAFQKSVRMVYITSLTIVNAFSNEYLTNVILYNSKNLLSNKNLIFYTSKQLSSIPKRKKHMYVCTCTKIRSKGGGFKIDGTFLFSKKY